MVTPELLQYIQQRLDQGATQEEIRRELQTQGWLDADIEEAFAGKPQDISSKVGSYLGSTPQKNPLLTRLKFIQFKYFGGRGILPLLLIVPLLILATVGYFVYFSPQLQINRMVAKMADTTMLSYKGTADISFTMPQTTDLDTSISPAFSLNDPITLAVGFEGKSNLKDPEKPASSTILDIEANASIINVKAKIESLTVEGQSFIKLLKLPDLGFIDFTPILNQWIILDEPEDEKGSYSLSEKERQSLTDKIENGKLLKITKSLGSKKINNVSTNGYRYEISKEELLNLARDYKNIIRGKVTDEELQSFEEIIDAAQEIDSITGEIWIGQWDSYLYKVLLDLKTKETSKQAKIDITTDIELTGHNKQVIIIKPESYKTQDELMQDLYPTNPYPTDPSSPLLPQGTSQAIPPSAVSGTPSPLLDTLLRTIQ